jgi:hypothetical protein
MQLAELLCMALAASTVGAAPVAQSWQDTVDEPLAEATAAIKSGTE